MAVRAAETKQDLDRMQERGIGFSDLVIAVNSDGPGGEARRPLGPIGIESTIWLETTKEQPAEEQTTEEQTIEAKTTEEQMIKEG